MILKTPPKLKQGDIHIWACKLQSPQPSLFNYETLLSAKEKERVSGFLKEKLRTRFIVSKGLSRKLLSLYLNISSDEIKFKYTPYGKPYLPNKAINFNISHSNELIIIALALSPIGIDIEYKRPLPNMLALSKRFFSESEYTSLLILEEHERIDAFYTLWVQKEAFIKAEGKGLFRELSSFEIIGSKNQKVIRMVKHKDKIKWSVIDINMHKDYKSAVVINKEKKSVKLSYFNS